MKNYVWVWYVASAVMLVSGIIQLAAGNEFVAGIQFVAAIADFFAGYLQR